MRPRNELSIAAALLSAGAAAIHASVAVPHFDESALYGLLFVATVLFQAGWAALVLAAPSVRLLGAGVVVNAGVIGAWAVSRTFGLPYGPEPWTAEPVGPLDLAATSFELGIVVCGLLLLRHASGLGRRFRPCPAPLRRRWGCRRRRHHLRGDRGHGARNGRTHAWPFDAASRTRLAVKRGREPSACASCRRTPRP
jgi:hypothetical protein